MPIGNLRAIAVLLKQCAELANDAREEAMGDAKLLSRLSKLATAASAEHTSVNAAIAAQSRRACNG